MLEISFKRVKLQIQGPQTPTNYKGFEVPNWSSSSYGWRLREIHVTFKKRRCRDLK